MFKENKVTIDGLELFYLRKPARSDTRHLVVVFSGFSGDGKPTYNYINTLLNCPADILWIKDYFHGGESYYLCSRGNFDIETKVIKFIFSILKELNLTINECTLLGGSKGGSAAIYYGMKYNFRNIIATVPQFHIGSYVEIDWNYAYLHMMGEKNAHDISLIKNTLDSMIIDVISTSEVDKNIYLITSTSDSQYATEVEPNLPLFKRFNNFNILYANSELINKHNQVNRHIVPITMSILSLSVMGVPPKFENKIIEYRSKLTEGEDYLSSIVSLKKMTVSDGKIFPEGIAFIKGIPCATYDDINFWLVFKNADQEWELPLAKGNKPHLTREFALNNEVCYDKGWFCTPQYQGIEFDSFLPGIWNLFIKINAKGIVRKVRLVGTPPSESNCSSYNKTMNLKYNSDGVVLTITNN
ncbi:accessory Sec system protein Asp2 [Atlantibacter hermannii]|uniref:accessory Sec system protein Asp2 n=1 Tax=Atlantibacter hermannii TaxID=565 RepID=UPI0022B783DD|nr:accessory Sec system protein Asp2 [Atlantibacter hermannii]MCZ7833611.1 alpha/beta hydrolase [Atlantibacter hermannii]